MGFGVATDKPNKGGLPSIDSKTGWLRDPQRFPIIIGLNSSDDKFQKKIRIGGQADIVVYTGSNGLLNALASFRIRFNSSDLKPLETIIKAMQSHPRVCVIGCFPWPGRIVKLLPVQVMSWDDFLDRTGAHGIS